MNRIKKISLLLVLFCTLSVTPSIAFLLISPPRTILEGYHIRYREFTTKAKSVTLNCYVRDNGGAEIRNFQGEINYGGRWESKGRVYVSYPDNDKCDYIFDELIEEKSPQFRVRANNIAWNGEWVMLDAEVNT